MTETMLESKISCDALAVAGYNMWFDIPNPWLGLGYVWYSTLVDSTGAIFGRFSYNFIYH